MKYLSLFSGYGGFELGIQQAYEKLCIENKKKEVSRIGDKEGQDKQQHNNSDEGLSCIGFSEIDKYATQVYKKHFNHKEYGDITKINPKELPDFDLICGGFPCQAFSIAGKRAGFEDTRGTLIYDVFRIIKEKHPKLVLLENVKGLLSHDNGRTFKTIITSLAELGYAVEWQVLNAKNFGVPQNRERVFIVGHLGGFGGRQIFPIGGEPSEDTRRAGKEISYTIDASYAKGTNTIEKSRRQIIQVNQPKHSNDRVYSVDGISPTLNTMQGGLRQPFVNIPEATKQGYATAEQGDSINLSVPNSKTRRGRVGKGIAQTLDTGMQQHTLQDARIRRLTPIECERLMGLKDNWTAEGTEGKISDSQRYKLCGNGVVVNVVEEIIKRLIK